MILINCEINIIRTWSKKSVITTNAVADQETRFAITNTKLFNPVVTVSAKDNTKLLQQPKSGFKRIIIWNKYQLRVSTQIQTLYLDYLIHPCFQEMNRLFGYQLKIMHSIEFRKDNFFQR